MTKSRRVLFLSWAPFFSGAERALLLTLRSLNGSRYEPCVLSGTEGEFATQVRALGIPCDVAPLLPFDKRHPVASARSIADVLRVARRCRASLIHANEAPSFQPGGYAARVLGIPTVTHVRFFDSAAGYRWFLRSRPSRALFVSQNLRTSALSEAPELFEGKSEVLYDAVEPRRVWSADDRNSARTALGLPLNRTIVAMTGQIAEVKGIWDFVEAAHILSSRGPDPSFAILGDDLKNGGATRRAMEERVAALGLTDRFTFLGFRTDAPEMVQAFDLVAVPSHVEPLGNSTLEAMSAGIPVIGTRVGGIPEMVVDGQTGVLVPPSDPPALAAAIDRIVHDTARRARMSVAGRQRAAEHFGFGIHCRRLASAYDTLVAARGVSVAPEGEVA
jgi:glycosyltransferase involved in cell wall biosynthesis